MKPAIFIVAILVVIVGIVTGLIAWSYTQIQVNLDNASFAGIDWAEASFATLVKLGLNVLSGNWMGAAFSLIQGVKFNFIFGLSNHGIFPVYIPDLSYNLSINGVNIGQGEDSVDVTINPGDTKEISILQNIQTNSLEPAITSIINTNGIMNLQVSGTAYFKLLGLTIPVPFQSTKQISIKDEIQNHVNSILAQNPQNSGSSNTLGTVANQASGIIQGIISGITKSTPPSQSVQFPTTQPQSYTPSRMWVSLSSDYVPVKSTVKIHVRLMGSGGQDWISGVRVDLMQNKGGVYDPLLQSCYTDSQGYCTLPVIPDTYGTYYFYVVFQGSTTYGPVKSDSIQVKAY